MMIVVYKEALLPTLMITLLIVLFNRLHRLITKITDSHESTEVDNLEAQQTEIGIAITGDIPSSNLENIDNGQDSVNMSVDNNNSTVTDVVPVLMKILLILRNKAMKVMINCQ